MIKLSENEHIVSVSRRHWWILAEKSVAVLFLALIPLFVYIIWGFAFPQIATLTEENITIINSFLFLGSVLFYLFLWLYFAILFIDYYLDLWVITNMRILDMEQKGLFNREVTECYISKIEDMTVEIKGVLPTFLNYGDLYLKTASEKGELVFREIFNPNAIKNIVLEQYNKQQLTVNH